MKGWKLFAIVFVAVEIVAACKAVAIKKVELDHDFKLKKEGK